MSYQAEELSFSMMVRTFPKQGINCPTQEAKLPYESGHLTLNAPLPTAQNVLNRHVLSHVQQIAWV